MGRKRKEEDIPGELGVQAVQQHERFQRMTGREAHARTQMGNSHSITHGIFANRFLSPDEKPLFEAIIAKLHQDFVFNKSSDFIQVELVGMYFLRLGRAQEAGDWEAAEKIDRMIRCHLKDLKATKISREGDAPKGPESTPADWATALVEKLKGKVPEEPDPAGSNRRGNAKSTSHNTVRSREPCPTESEDPAGKSTEDCE